SRRHFCRLGAPSAAAPHLNTIPRCKEPSMLIRPLEPADIDQVSAINEAGVPGVTPADVQEVTRLVELSEFSVVAVDEADDATVLGFLIVMAPGVAYESENYRWFSERGTDFLYIDRIAIADGHRGEGI